MQRVARVSLSVLIVGLSACGGSSVSTQPLQTTNLVTNGTFTATVNGSAWGALGKVVVTRPTANSVSLFAVSTTYGFSFALLNVTGPTTVSLVSAPSNGSQVIASGPGQGGWATGADRRHRQRCHHGADRESHHGHVLIRCDADPRHADDWDASRHERGVRSELLANLVILMVAKQPEDLLVCHACDKSRSSARFARIRMTP